MTTNQYQKAKELDVQINQLGEILEFIKKLDMNPSARIVLQEYGETLKDKHYCYKLLRKEEVAVIIKALEDEREKLENEFNNL